MSEASKPHTHSALGHHHHNHGPLAGHDVVTANVQPLHQVDQKCDVPVAGHDFVAANAHHFDRLGQKFEEYPFAKELTQRQATAILGAYPFDEKTVMLDFACGPGLVSRELAPYTKQIVGVDISQVQVDAFNKHVNDQGISPDEMKAVYAHLKGEDSELDGMKFDVIICGMAYHHFPSIEETTKMLTFFLKPGGVLLVTDILNQPGQEAALHKAAAGVKGWEHAVAHKGGFTEEQLRSVFEAAGLRFELNILAKAKHHGFPAKLIIVKGVKSG